MKFSDLGLAEPIRRALSARNHIIPTPIQARAIPELLAGRDMLGIAQTGTGKTAAFALPILHRLSGQSGNKRPRGPRALILAPTRELAIQIGEEFRAYGRHLKLRQTVIFGGVSQRPQVNALARGVDIVIATPGRLLDLMGQRRLGLQAVEFLVLDEADRMLDMGFVRDVRKIISALPKARQSLLFSATMPDDVARLSGEILADPVRIEVTPQATPIERIEQQVHHVNATRKGALLAGLLDDPALSRVIVFARTKHRANRVAKQLVNGGVAAEAIHGNKSQGARQRALKRFRDGEARVLVATDIAARGIDVDGVSHVVNFELPNEPESYVHRIGRTARAGAGGVAVSFCDPSEQDHLRGIERLIRRRLTVIGGEPAATTPDGLAEAAKPRGGPRHKRGRPRPTPANANAPRNRARRRKRAA
ncbi:MAG: DEAD/DEAH box helicase [Alphaproteobacteria bacterium]|jgi:ATP-dependent RNA helicase RhlE|nr:DEAD/DEAH box helicase [Alphaproteobacteria bacterium]MDP6814514.1 DEAD/DEAH box helicase [Alphaproteobacteria bacterium]